MSQPMMSGHCLFPATERVLNGAVVPVSENYSHAEMCKMPGCGCACHLGETYECAGCGRDIREAPGMENADEPGEMVYMHVAPDTGRATGEEC